MSQKAVKLAFNLEKAKQDILATHDQFNRFEKLTISLAAELGRKLLAVKSHLGHGRWMAWVSTDLRWTVQRAYRFMQVAQFVDETGFNTESGVELGELYR